jgi:hypothetical protein
MESAFAKRLGSVWVAWIVLLGSWEVTAGVSIRLVYTRSENAAACPDEGALRAAVAQRLG